MEEVSKMIVIQRLVMQDVYCLEFLEYNWNPNTTIAVGEIQKLKMSDQSLLLMCFLSLYLFSIRR